MTDDLPGLPTQEVTQPATSRPLPDVAHSLFSVGKAIKPGLVTPLKLKGDCREGTNLSGFPREQV